MTDPLSRGESVSLCAPDGFTTATKDTDTLATTNVSPNRADLASHAPHSRAPRGHPGVPRLALAPPRL